METESRTAKGVKNAKMALLFYCLNLILQFFSRKVFLDYLGAEVLGLNTTAQNLLGFLNLAELGIGSAIAYTLYRPIFEKNIQTINEIVSVQGWMYRRIAWVVIGGSCVLMCFFPWIFEKAEVPLWYAYASFCVLLVASLLGYFVNYRQIVLTADQKEYKITLNIQGLKLLKVFLQIIAIRFLIGGYVYWLILEFVAAILTAIVLDRVLKKEYPWLHTLVSEGRLLKRKYPQIITKTKQVFFHQIGCFVLFQTSPLVIYAYASLTLVAIYGNYMLVVTGVFVLMNALMNSINAGVGNLVAEGDRLRIKRVFWELTAFRYWLASVICFGMYRLTHSFITLWIGEEYVMEQSAFIVLMLISFISLTRTNDVFLNAYGLFQDVWAPLVEALLNLGGSLLLGYFFELTGILTGVVISLLLIVCGWKPYFLYCCGFKEPVWEYVFRKGKFLLLLVVGFTLSSYFLSKIFPDTVVRTYYDWMRYALKVVFVYSLLSFPLFYFSEQGIRDFTMRVKRILRK